MPLSTRLAAACTAAAVFATTGVASAARIAVTAPVAGTPSGIAAVVTRRTDLRDLGRLAPNATVSVVATLAYEHAGELEQLVKLQSNPRSPYYRHFLSQAQFQAYFSPSVAHYAQAANALQRAGFRVTRLEPNRTLLHAIAPSEIVERTFSTQMHRVEQLGRGVRFTNATPAVLPASLRGIVRTVSLNDLIVAQPAIRFAANAGRHIVDARTVAIARDAAARHSDACFFGICFGATPTPTPTPKPTATPTVKPTATPTAKPSASPTVVPTASPTAAPTASPTATPAGGSAPIGGALKGPDNGYGPIAVADGYDLPVQHGYNGTGRATGVVISGDFSETDLATYLAYFGITRTGPATTRVEIDGGATYSSTFSTSNASVEAALDVETIVGNAPGTHLVMYLIPSLSSQDIEDAYNSAVTGNVVDVLNSSFGGCETSDTSFTQTVDTIAQQGAAEGITFSASSGDSGSAECGTSLFGFGGSNGVSSPASAPHIVAVGGTTFNVSSSAAYTSEAAWSGSGGGVSTVFAEPSYQTGVGGTASTSGRNVPDVAFAADPNTGTSLYFGGAWNGPIGGTSWASPIFSAVQTEVDQRDGARVGFANPRIYSAYASNGYAIFHDVTSGNNGSFSAGTGYDNATGIGSTKSTAFAAKE